MLSGGCGGEPVLTNDMGTTTENTEQVESGDDSPWISVGTGSRFYVPLIPGDEVDIIYGIQGGYHVWGGFEVSGILPDDVLFDFYLESGGEVVAEAHYIDSLEQVGVNYQYGGVAVILTPTPESVSGDVAILRVELSDSRGTVLSDEVEIIPICCIQ